MSGCGYGYVILITPPWNTKKVAVYDPLTGALHLFPAPPYELLGGESEYTEAEFHVISSQADDRSFRLLCVSRDKGRTQVAVFPPDTTSREWQISPTTGNLRHVGNNGTLVNGFLYWVSVAGSTIHVLNTATLQFSQIDLPIGVSCGQATYKACLGETKDGKLCLVRATDLRLCIWVRRAAGDDDCVEKWLQDKTFQISDAIHELALGIIDECPWVNVVAIVGGLCICRLTGTILLLGGSCPPLKQGNSRSSAISLTTMRPAIPTSWRGHPLCYAIIRRQQISPSALKKKPRINDRHLNLAGDS
uniref:Uncharacterized protein n=1 Tax=Avena sativa TaxID=4498 RepID=A0ACD5ZX17_AVESA